MVDCRRFGRRFVDTFSNRIARANAGQLLGFAHIRRSAIPAMSITSSRNQVLRGPAKRKAYHALTDLVAVAGATALWAGTTVEWKGGGGNWEDAVMWGGTLPSRMAEARINGTQDKPSQVILAHTNVLVNHLSVADDGNSLASLILDGPSLTVSGPMDVGKYNGSDGRLVVKSGHLFAHQLAQWHELAEQNGN